VLVSVRRAGKRATVESRSGTAPPTEPAVSRVLVADRCPDTVASTKWLLRRWGHDVCGVRSGSEVLEVVEKYRPDVVLMEIGLPRLDGWQVARLLRQRGRWPSTWLVAVTGYGSALDRARSREAGFDGHFVKPADPEVLRAWLAVRCGTAGGGK
jgi:CheY-like chemotaxis protein